MRDKLLTILKEADDKRHGYNKTISEILKLVEKAEQEAKGELLEGLRGELKRLLTCHIKDCPYDHDGNDNSEQCFDHQIGEVVKLIEKEKQEARASELQILLMEAGYKEYEKPGSVKPCPQVAEYIRDRLSELREQHDQ